MLTDIVRREKKIMEAFLGLSRPPTTNQGTALLLMARLMGPGFLPGFPTLRSALISGRYEQMSSDLLKFNTHGGDEHLLALQQKIPDLWNEPDLVSSHE